MSDRILGAACIAVGVAMAWAAKDYAAPISYEPVGPRAFPLLLAALMAAGGVWLLIRPGENDRWLHEVPLRPGSTGCCAIAVMTVPVGMAFGGSALQSLGGGIGLGLISYFLFDKVLDVVLPTGVLSFLLGGR